MLDLVDEIGPSREDGPSPAGRAASGDDTTPVARNVETTQLGKER
jgi:hypothetical protein